MCCYNRLYFCHRKFWTIYHSVSTCHVSQISGLFITPFPHFKVHFEILLLDVSGAHSYPFSMVHVLLQPSPFTLFLSSQISGLFITPFPHFKVHFEILSGVGCVWSTFVSATTVSIYIIFVIANFWTIYHSVSTF